MRRIFWVVMLLATAVQAAVPARMNYQGRLMDAGGPVNNPALGITFRIFDAPAGGTQLWTELQTVAVSGGLFNVELGAVTPLSTPVFTGLQPWLEMQVTGDPVPLTPRARLVTAPYAFVASNLALPATVTGGSLSLAAHVDFSGATVTGLGMAVPNPLDLTNATAVPVLSVSNAGAGEGVHAYALNDYALSGESLNSTAIYGYSEGNGVAVLKADGGGATRFSVWGEMSNPGGQAGVIGNMGGNVNTMGTGSSRAGVIGLNNIGTGVFAQSENGTGLVAIGTSQGLSASASAGTAIYGQSLGSSAPAIQGSHGGPGILSAGVLGQSTNNGNTSRVGVFGRTDNSMTPPTGRPIGAAGMSSALNSVGVYAFSNGGNSYGVMSQGFEFGVSATAASAVGIGVVSRVSTTAAGAAGQFTNDGSGPALRLGGSASLTSSSGVLTMASFVSFTAGTNLGSGVPVPLSLSAAVAFPGGVITATNTGSGSGIVGYATVPGPTTNGPPSLNDPLPAGVKGYSSVSNSAGVLGLSSVTTTSGAGVGGLGFVGIVGFGRGDLAGSVGGSFQSDAGAGVGIAAQAVSGTGINALGVTGVAVTVLNPDGVGVFISATPGARALTAYGYNTPGQSLASVTQVSPGGGKGLSVYNYASASAAVEGVAVDGTPLYLGGSAAGVVGQGGAIGVGGGSGLTGGVGVLGSAPLGVGIFAVGATALKVSGNAEFDGAGNTVIFNSYVSFTAGTNLAGGAVPNPLSLSNTSAGAVIYGANYGPGGGIQGYSGSFAPGVLGNSLAGAGGYFSGSPGLQAAANSSGGNAIFAWLTSTAAGVEVRNFGTGTALSATAVGAPAILASSSTVFGNGATIPGVNPASAGVAVGGLAAGDGIGVLGMASTPNSFAVKGEHSGGGAAVMALNLGSGVAVSATADPFSGTAGHFQGATGVAVYAGNMPIHAVNTAGGGFLPAIFAEVVNTNTGVLARNTANGNTGSLAGPVDTAHFEMGVGAQGVSAGNPGNVGVHGFSAQGPGVRGDGDTGVAGYVTSSTGTALYGDASGRPAAKALHTLGNARFDGLGNTATFNVYVSFTAGTNLAAGAVSAPLSLTLSSVLASPLSLSNAAGAAGSFQGLTALVLTGGTLGLSVTAVGSNSYPIYARSSNGTTIIEAIQDGGSDALRATANNGIALNAYSNSAGGRAIFARNLGGPGSDLAGATYGVSATASGASGAAGIFQALTAVVAAGNMLGLQGSSAQSTGFGVLGRSDFGAFSQPGFGSAIYGFAERPNNTAILGVAGTGSGAAAIYGRQFQNVSPAVRAESFGTGNAVGLRAVASVTGNSIGVISSAGPTEPPHPGRGIGLFAYNSNPVGAAIEADGSDIGVSASARSGIGVGGLFRGVVGGVSASATAASGVGVAAVNANPGATIPAQGSALYVQGRTVITSQGGVGSSDIVDATANSYVAYATPQSSGSVRWSAGKTGFTNYDVDGLNGMVDPGSVVLVSFSYPGPQINFGAYVRAGNGNFTVTVNPGGQTFPANAQLNWIVVSRQ